MFIQKVFHVRRDLPATKAALSNVQLYRRSLAGVRKAYISDVHVAQFDLQLTDAFSAHFVVAELPAPEADQVLFHSTAGNVGITGLIEFSQIRENFTEVQVTLEYTYKSVLHRLLDTMGNLTERFVDAQLRRLEGWFDGTVVPMESAPVTFAAHLPRFAA